MNTRLPTLAAALACGLGCVAVQAQDKWPSRAIEIIYPTSHGDLCHMTSQHRPVGFDMIKIIKVDPAHCIHLHIFYDCSLRQVRHLVVLVPEFKRNEGLETTCLILEFTQSPHMIYAMEICFDMSIENSCIGSLASLMP